MNATQQQDNPVAVQDQAIQTGGVKFPASRAKAAKGEP